MTMEIRGGRGVGKEADHIYLHLDHLDPKILHERLPGISESAKNLRRRRRDEGADPGAADGALQTWAASPRTSTARCCTKKNGDADKPWCPASWRSARRPASRCTAPTRLGSNSLIDLVVFGRAAGPALRRDRQARRGQGAAAEGPPPTRRWRASTASATQTAARPPRTCVSRCRKTMQNNCAVFRTGEVLSEGQTLIHDVWGGLGDISTKDRSADLQHGT